MIDAKELRIGNWVNVVPQNYYLKIIGDHITAVEKNSSCADPIPLTPEILVKAGFKRGAEHGDRNVFYSTGIHKIDMQITLSGNVLIGNKNQSLPYNLEGLHHLQNLYFALTGKELEINL